jgi:hypothetical protein
MSVVQGYDFDLDNSYSENDSGVGDPVAHKQEVLAPRIFDHVF